MSLRSIGLHWKIGLLYSGLLLIFAAMTAGTMLYFAQQMLQHQIDRHRLALATGFGDSAAGHLASKNLLAVRVLASRYAVLEGTKYAFVRNGRGEIIAHSFSAFPESLRNGLTAVNGQVQRRAFSLSGKPIEEISVPVLDGQLGVAHLGFAADTFPAELRRNLMPLLAALGGILLFGMILAFTLAWWIARPIVQLSAIAERITKGDLESGELGQRITSGDEVGALATSLERMRSSLKAALSRLAREVS